MSHRTHPVPYRSLTVHRTPQDKPAAPQPAASRFAQLLEQSGRSGDAEDWLTENGGEAAGNGEGGISGKVKDPSDASNSQSDGQQGESEQDDGGASQQEQASYQYERMAEFKRQTLSALSRAALTERSAPAAAMAAPVAAVPASIKAIAETVSRFCRDSAMHGEGWQIRLPLRNDILADTVLEMGISAQCLRLRFLSSEQSSQRLIYTHQQSLRELLGTALEDRYEIAIELDWTAS
ncbi:type III secretion HpaP family protein [Bordetella muralis]|jgi:hypothetical protein|uniref:type III secretion HpaP family protein n=1 Tax=Bordetella muralis TaxID=1649130 RepID=UPI0039F0F62A